jgi:hypothetical protein
MTNPINRWETFTDEELHGLKYVIEISIIGDIGEVDLRAMHSELKAEQARRLTELESRQA